MEDFMYNIHVTSKWKNYEHPRDILRLSRNETDNQINDKLTIKQNIILDTIVRYDHHRGLTDVYT
jgi:hypothetical protein